MTALDKLIEAVELPCVSLKASYMLDTLPLGARTHCWRAHAGSLDAALALHEALLPGWHWQHGFAVGGHGSHAATAWLPHMEDAQWKVHFAVSETPARAWLLAILRAYRSVQA